MPSLPNLSHHLMKTQTQHHFTSRNYVLVTMLLVLCFGSPAPLAQAAECAAAAAPDSSATAAGEHLLCPADTADMEQRYTKLFEAALRAASSRRPEEISFWSDTSALGGCVVHNGRFREFYVSETAFGRTLWFRDTAGPQGEFPRTRVQYQFTHNSSQGVVSHGFYLSEGKPVRTPHAVAIMALRETCDFWLGILGASGTSQLASAGK